LASLKGTLNKNIQRSFFIEMIIKGAEGKLIQQLFPFQKGYVNARSRQGVSTAFLPTSVGCKNET